MIFYIARHFVACLCTLTVISVTSLAGYSAHAQNTPIQKIQLIDGDTLTGQILSDDGIHTILLHPTLGQIILNNDTIIPPSDEPEPASASASASVSAPTSTSASTPASTPSAAKPIPVEPVSLFPGWESNFASGISGSQGNSQTFGINTKFVAKRQTKDYRTAIDAAYYYESSNSSSTKNQVTTGFTHDWLIPESQWFNWIEARFNWDQFQSWDYRINIGGGLGYNLIAKDDLSVDLRAGFGASKEWGSADDQWKPEVIFGTDGDWKISDNQSLLASTRVYPDLNEIGEFRTRSTIEWKIALDKAKGLNLNLGFVHEYESIVGPGTKKNNLTYYGALSVDF